MNATTMTTVGHIEAMLKLALQKKTKEVSEHHEALRLKLYSYQTEARAIVLEDKDVAAEVARVSAALKQVNRYPEWSVRADVEYNYDNLSCGPSPRESRPSRNWSEAVTFYVRCETREAAYGQSAHFTFPKEVRYKSAHAYSKLVKEWRATHLQARDMAERLQRLLDAEDSISLTAQSMHLKLLSPREHSNLSDMISDLIESI